MSSHSSDSTDQADHIFLLRHGECEKVGIVRGSTDSRLTELGRQQMDQSILGHSAWTDIVCSPLSRCQSFAQDLAAREDVPLIVESGLQEIDFGDWEGLSWLALQREQPDALQAYFDDPLSNSTHGGERYDVFLQRVLESWRGLLPRLSGKRVLIVTHGGVIRALLSSFLKIPLESQTSLLVPYACLTHLLLYPAEDSQRVFLQSHSCANTGAQ